MAAVLAVEQQVDAVTALVGWVEAATKPNCSNCAAIRSGSGEVNSANSNPSRPIGFTSI
jgi:hypothetical protein